jgi:prophage antirepressor-like protein
MINQVQMKTNIQIFNNPQFGNIRIAMNEQGEPLFCLFDTAKALGYENPSKAVIDHCKGVTVLETPTNGGIQQMKFGKEAEVYRLIMKSKLPDAEKFQDWVCEDILPSIRKTGGYIASRQDETPEEIMARALVVANETINRHKQRVQMLEGENTMLQTEIKAIAPKAEYTDKVLQSVGTYTMTQVAKELGMSAIALERKLHEKGVLFKQSGQWLLYAKDQDKGYTRARTHQYTHSDGSAGTNTITVWTETGRMFVHATMKTDVKREQALVSC